MLPHTAKRLIIISRPLMGVLSLAVFTSGYLLSGMAISWSTIVGAAFCFLPMGIMICGLNDIADRESDAQNDRKGGAEGAVITKAETRLILWAAILSGLVPIIVFALTERYLAALTILGLALFAYTYSVPPIRLKTRPILDSFSNGIWILLVLLLGFFVNTTGWSDIQFPTIPVLITTVLGTTAFHALGALMDYDVDKRVGDNTVAIFLGKRGTALYSFGLFTACLVIINGRNAAVDTFFGACVVLAAWLVFDPATQRAHRFFQIIALLVLVATGFLVVFGL
ncbi:MAG TPA: UbiA family prenyltransferase [Nevskiaceae bacterium]|nr:UbiA family prenyltransferase [Nevskiaceae bacterium]